MEDLLVNTRRKVLFTLICFFILLSAGKVHVKAAAVDSAVEVFKDCLVYSFDMESIKNDKIVVNWSYRNNYTTDSDYGDYSNPFIDIQGFEIQVCRDKNYPADQVKTYKLNKYVESADGGKYSYKIPVSVLGKNGGKLYGRIRAYGTIKTIEAGYDSGEPTTLQVGDVVYSGYQDLDCWHGYTTYSNFEEEMGRDHCEYVKINKTNFGGMYALIKDGFYYCDPKGKKSYYDKNHDGWLDPAEIKEIYTLNNYSYKKYASGYEMLWGTEMYQCKISDLKGLKYLPFVTSIDLRDYTGTKLDLTDYPHIRTVSMCEFWKSKFQLIAPYAKEIRINSETGGSWKKAKLSSVDVSKCKAVVYLTLGGSYFKPTTMKLPASAKNLRWISVSYGSGKKIDLNKYKKLNLAYFYANKYSECKFNQCTKLNYVYFYCMDNLRSVDLRNAKSLKGADIYCCNNLSSSGLKTVKGTRVTKNQGRWWESTDTWRKLFDDIYKSM